MYKKFALLMSLSLLGITGFTYSAKANSPNGALVVRDFECGVFDGNGGLQLVSNSHSVENNNVQTFYCKGQVPNDTGKAVQWTPDSNPFGPGTQYRCLNGLASTNWRTTISASGNNTTQVTCPSSR